MRPFALLESTGVDTTSYGEYTMFKAFKVRGFAPSALLNRAVLAG
jgi:hypothetical protein